MPIGVICSAKNGVSAVIISASRWAASQRSSPEPVITSGMIAKLGSLELLVNKQIRANGS